MRATYDFVIPSEGPKAVRRRAEPIGMTTILPLRTAG